MYIASRYHHDRHGVFIDAVFSPTWEDEADDRFTFGCRVGEFTELVDHILVHDPVVRAHVYGPGVEFA